jgi:protein phosphatase
MFDILVEEYTDAGDVRDINQDSIFSVTKYTGQKSAGLFVVADGCGGLFFGEEASKLVVTHFNMLWDTKLEKFVETCSSISDDMIFEVLENAIVEINNISINFGNLTNNKVGTTLSILFVVEDKYYIKNVGDSRIYLARKGKAEQLTEDQSLIADMVRNKEMTLEEAKNFSKKNVLTMCIGVFDEIKTYTKTGRIKSGDLFLLCSDGLYNYVPENLFYKLMSGDNKGSMADMARLLRDSIPKGSARDNVSFILIKFK